MSRCSRLDAYIACFFPSDFNLFRRYPVVPTPYLCFTVLSMTCHVRVISCYLGLLSHIFPLHQSNKVMFNYELIMQR
ncbi:hypothetical protein CY34DRAFT_497128 [Suillus luteus UH-Slu-Lm8-n1]|uniref:Uncharacterized protein n=1 Tax=Suillus luteus UH-Slu-Lm8-n1 TaxID=930992 RepID=A0A0D0A555_9AGAM|nr:hypothetical protein CY34DRAFT_497128 [Suillus luteus UH-Slu-Lm8-n1]